MASPTRWPAAWMSRNNWSVGSTYHDSSMSIQTNEPIFAARLASATYASRQYAASSVMPRWVGLAEICVGSLRAAMSSSSFR